MCIIYAYIDLAEHPVREIGAQDPVGCNADQGLEPGFRSVPGGAHHGGFRAAGYSGLHAGSHRRRSSSSRQAGDDVAKLADEVAGQVQDRMEQILRISAAKNSTKPRARDLERWKHGRHQCGEQLPSRVATLARLSQGAVYILYIHYRAIVLYYWYRIGSRVPTPHAELVPFKKMI